MEKAFGSAVKWDLLKVGHCGHPECVVLSGGSRRAIQFPSLVGLIEHPRHGLILYDTGYSPRFREATARFPECLYRLVTPVRLPPEEELLVQLEDRGWRASDISTVVISHFHADHVAGLRDFPGARFIATRTERRDNEARGRLGRLRRAYLRDLLPDDFEAREVAAEERPVLPLPQNWAPFRSGWDLLGDGSLVGIDLPGHTASQLGLAFRGEEGGVFFVGDACWKIEGLEQDRPPSRAAFRFFADAPRYAATFAALRDLLGREDAPLLVPSHCATTWQRHGGTRNIHRD